MQLVRSTTPRPRSGLVTFLAWITLVPSAIGVLGGAVSLLIMPRLAVALVLAGSVTTFVTALGLRRRRNWARLAFIWILSFAILNAFISLYRARWAPQRETLALVVVFVLAAVNGLIIASLSSDRIREEFDSGD
jgi:hypothetical protein